MVGSLNAGDPTKSQAQWDAQQAPLSQFSQLLNQNNGPVSYEQKSIAEFVASFANYSDAQMKDLQDRLVKANLIPHVTGLYDKETRTAVFNLALVAAAKNDPSATFDSMLNHTISVQQQLAGSTMNKTTTTTHTNFTSALDAQAIAQSTLTNILGRDPTPQETSKFATLLHSAQAANPTRTTRTTGSTIDPATGGAVVTNETTSGGLDQNAATLLAQQQAVKAPDYQAMQAVKYANILSQMANAVNSAGTSTAGA